MMYFTTYINNDKANTLAYIILFDTSSIRNIILTDKDLNELDLTPEEIIKQHGPDKWKIKNFLAEFHKVVVYSDRSETYAEALVL